MTRQEMRDLYRNRHNAQESRFFGAYNKCMSTNNYYTYKHVLSDDEIIINTGNVIKVKDSMVLVVGKNKAVYLKDWAVKAAHNCKVGGVGSFFIVKLNRQYFKPYTFNRPFDDFCMDHDQDFDYLLNVAREQDAENMEVASEPLVWY